MNFEEYAQVVQDFFQVELTDVSISIILAMTVVVFLILIASIVSIVISIVLAVKYRKYNRLENSLSKTGEQIARTILDKNDLQKIEVTKSGSFIFGNSYSHFFKKVRLRKQTWQKKSITSMAMATQKSSLAVLDKQGDKDMKTRIRLSPIIYGGPLAFIPLIVIGILLDTIILHTDGGLWTIIFTCIGAIFYLISFIMSIMVLKTEKKAQNLALEIMKQTSIATEEEIQMCKKLFKLYNIEYVNNMIIALLELILRVLQIIAMTQNGSVSSASSK